MGSLLSGQLRGVSLRVRPSASGWYIGEQLPDVSLFAEPLSNSAPALSAAAAAADTGHLASGTRRRLSVKTTPSDAKRQRCGA